MRHHLSLLHLHSGLERVLLMAGVSGENDAPSFVVYFPAIGELLEDFEASLM